MDGALANFHRFFLGTYQGTESSHLTSSRKCQPASFFKNHLLPSTETFATAVLTAHFSSMFKAQRALIESVIEWFHL